MKSILLGEPLGAGREWRFAMGLVLLTMLGGCGSDGIGEMGAGGAGGIGGHSGAVHVDEGDDPRNWGSLEEGAAYALQPSPANAQACSTGGECASGFCVDGVCCDSACTGTCQACTAAKKGSGDDGTCGTIALYGDPDNECAAGSCDGAGACKLYNGNACGAAGECLSGHCVDGFCCGNACDGTCRACSIEKRGGGYNGQCGPIAAGGDPDNECSGGSCNGASACEMAGSGTTCSLSSGMRYGLLRRWILL
ncbi:MAG: hypothetical protein IPM54_09775 [Polyangiaceae bacterium]|nr:hypothetical protein [Polyangiaceae bacterium]